MSEELALSAYFGERDRSGGRSCAQALLDLYEHRGLRSSILLRGSEGFGLVHHRQTEALLLLSEDPPLVSVAWDERETVQAVVPEVDRLLERGLITLERVSLGPAHRPLGSEAKLTVLLDRGQRTAGAAAAPALIDLMQRRGLAGAMVMLGVDGTAAGQRHRAHFLGGNRRVALMVVGVGETACVAGLTSELERMLPGALCRVSPTRVLKRDGQRLMDPALPEDKDPDGSDAWHKLSVYSGVQARHEGRLLHPALVRQLRDGGARGATTVHGVWGYHGRHRPYGDRSLALRRHVPTVTVVIDRPAAMRRWWTVVDRLTHETGLVTGETVPALRSRAPGLEHGSLALLEPGREG